MVLGLVMRVFMVVVVVVVIVLFICVDVDGSSAGGGFDGVDYELLLLGLNSGF